MHVVAAQYYHLPPQVLPQMILTERFLNDAPDQSFSQRLFRNRSTSS